MIFTLLLLNLHLCFSLKTSCETRKLFFIKSQFQAPYRNGTQKVYEYDESFNELVDNLASDNPYSDETGQERDTPRDHLDLSVNSVTICGRIGFIAEPFVFQNGVKCLKLSIATSERARSGLVKTDWHKVMLYGVGNVDYIYSRARVGDRALVIGQLRYYQPQNFDASGVARPKISEIYVNSSRGNHKFILLPKNPSTLENTYLEESNQVYPTNY